MEELCEEDFAAPILEESTSQELNDNFPNPKVISSNYSIESEYAVERIPQDLFVIPPPVLGDSGSIHDLQDHSNENTEFMVSEKRTLENQKQLSSFINAFDEEFHDDKLSNLKTLGLQSGPLDAEPLE